MGWFAWGLNAVERGWLPDGLIRVAIRRLCAERLRELKRGSEQDQARAYREFLDDSVSRPIAPSADLANEQHYEQSAEFFRLILGPRGKYSCCLWARSADTLASAEEASLAETCRRAEIRDGMRILDLGCGWGSLCLWAAERYPQSQVVAISNSHRQRQHIEEQIQRRGLDNLRVMTADMNHFQTDEAFDRVVSVEMFEHMRNLGMLLKNISRWLAPGGKLFVHHFCHRRYAYPFQTRGDRNWMGRHFFSDGTMYAEDSLRHFSDHLRPEQSWSWNGLHYQRTALAWLANLDRHRRQALEILASTRGRTEARLLLQRWRIFFLAVAELFGYRDGTEWYVAHHRLVPVSAGDRSAPREDAAPRTQLENSHA